MAKFPAAFEDSSGKIQRLTGELDYLPNPGATPGDVLTVQADGSIAAAPGGGGATPTANTYFGNLVSIGNGTSAPLTADFSSAQGAALLDVSTPAAPTFVAAGAYVLSARIATADAMTAGGLYNVDVTFPDSTLTDLLPDGQADAQATAADPLPTVTVTMPYLAAAGDRVVVSVTNLDGVQSIHFRLACLSVVKVA